MSFFPVGNKTHDAKGKSHFPLLPGVTGRAAFSEDQVYRYWLGRSYQRNDKAERAILWIGLNPSVASADVDDPTIRKELSWTAKWGYNVYWKVNICDYRSADPKDLMLKHVQPRSKDNIANITRLADSVEKIVLCYGLVHRQLWQLGRETLVALKPYKDKLFCFGYTQGGFPKHTLYLPKKTELLPFDPTGFIRSPF